MKKILSALIIIGTVITSCANSKNNITVIKGNVPGIPASKVYLVDGWQWKTKLDSATYADGKFEFSIPNNTEPIMVSILYFDKSGKPNKLLYWNNEVPKIGMSAFMLDHGTINISGQWDGNVPFTDFKHLKIEAGPQNIFYQKSSGKNVGYLDNTNPTTHQNSLKQVTLLINQHPYAYYLLNEIYSNRAMYSKDELNMVLGLFDKDVRNSKKASALKEYLLNRPDPGEATKELSLVNDKGVLTPNINKKQKVNMLIFWASWCQPCRLELPSLKEIRKSYDSPDFYMASISIDKDPNKWKDALKQENMDWDQYNVLEKDLDKIMAQYGFSSIPLIIFTDKSGKEIKRFDGYNEKHTIEYKALIKKLLTN